MTNPTTTFNLITVTVKGRIFLNAKDVADYIRELAATEETDVRGRLNEAAQRLESIGCASL